MKSARVMAVLSALLAVACDNLGDDKIARLEGEVRALRAEQAARPLAVTEALSPLRGAVDVLVERGETERARWASVTSELTQLATLMQTVVDDKRRVEVEALRARVVELERQIKEQIKAHVAERELLLKALDLAATKLEALLRQGTASRDSSPAPPAPPPVRRSWQDPLVVWSVALGALAFVAVWWLSRAGRRGAQATALAVPVGPDVVVDAPAPEASDAWAPRGGPLPLRVDLGTADAEGARARVTDWLAREPRVLTVPAPVIEPRGPTLHVRLFVHDGMCAAERASLAADVLLRGQSPALREQVSPLREQAVRAAGDPDSRAEPCSA